MIAEELKILLVEDNPTDVQLIKRQLGKAISKPDVKNASTLEEVDTAMKLFKPDIVISDYNLPTCNGGEVLDLVMDLEPDMTFIFLTGTLQDEELAADTILSGASGFILKNNINKLHEKLIPIITKQQAKSQKISTVEDRLSKSKKLIQDLEQYLEAFNSNNQAHRESINRIREDLDKLNNR